MREDEDDDPALMSKTEQLESEPRWVGGGWTPSDRPEKPRTEQARREGRLYGIGFTTVVSVIHDLQPTPITNHQSRETGIKT